VAEFNILSKHFPRGTEGITKDLDQDSRSPDRYLNPGRPEYKRVLTARLLRSVTQMYDFVSQILLLLKL
jgi:hypothetical protein